MNWVIVCGLKKTQRPTLGGCKAPSWGEGRARLGGAELKDIQSPSTTNL